WKSPDLWNCRSNSTCTSHENPGYAIPNTNTLRVKVTNKGCDASIANNGMIYTYWTLGSTGEDWSSAWVNATLCGDPAGDMIHYPMGSGSGNGQLLPAIAPGAEHIFDFDWKPINHNSYNYS